MITFPPPASLHAVMAFLMASLLLVTPSETAPKSTILYVLFGNSSVFIALIILSASSKTSVSFAELSFVLQALKRKTTNERQINEYTE